MKLETNMPLTMAFKIVTTMVLLFAFAVCVGAAKLLIGNEEFGDNPANCTVLDRRVHPQINETAKIYLPFWRRRVWKPVPNASVISPVEDPPCCWFSDRAGAQIPTLVISATAAGKKQENLVPRANVTNEYVMGKNKIIKIPYDERYFENNGFLIPLLSTRPDRLEFFVYGYYNLLATKDKENCQQFVKWNSSINNEEFERAKWEGNNMISFSYSRYQNGTLCQNLIIPDAQHGRVVDISKNELNYELRIRAKRMEYSVIIQWNQKNGTESGYSTVVKHDHQTFQHDSIPKMCPFNFRRLRSGGYYVPFRVLPPQRYSTNPSVDGQNWSSEPVPRQRNCPLYIGLGLDQYRLLIEKPGRYQSGDVPAPNLRILNPI